MQVWETKLAWTARESERTGWSSRKRPDVRALVLPFGFRFSLTKNSFSKKLYK
jgi:hypothetical protein